MGGQLDELFGFSGSPLPCSFTIFASLHFVLCSVTNKYDDDDDDDTVVTVIRAYIPNFTD